MEKRIWSKPEMNEFAFAANEYVSTCYYGFCDIDAGKTGEKIEIEIKIPEIGTIGKIKRDLYKLFFAWNDTGDGEVQSNEVDLNNIVNGRNQACNEPFNAEGSYVNVATPDTLFYQDPNDWNAWKSVNEITDNTEWTKAYHFEGSGSTHLCKTLNESGKS